MEGAKPKAVEELVDFYFHRRLARPVVLGAARLKLTPNQVTWLSLFAGLWSAYLFSKSLFPIASLILLAAVVLDCSDGMLARITGTSSPIGRILDGFFDAVWISLAWVGIRAGGHFSYPPQTVLTFMAFAAASMLLHCWTYDGVKTTYVALCEPGFSEKNLSWQEAGKRARENFPRKPFDALIYFFMFLHHSVFVRSAHQAPALDDQRRARARVLLATPMRVWSFLGEGTHLALMIAAGLLTPLFPDALLAAFGIILVPMNLLWIAAAFLWFRAKKRAIASPFSLG